MLFGRFRLRAPDLVPDPAPARSLAGWGEAFDPRGDCSFEPGGTGLAIVVPGSLHDLSVEQGQVDAPRVLRPVRGDFVAAVKVAGQVRPAGEPTARYAYPYHGAGLLLWQDSNHYVRLERAAILRGSQIIPYVNFERRGRGRMASSLGTAVAEGPVRLRLERAGGRILASFSPDGRLWTPLPAMAADLAGDLAAGVAAVNTATAPFRAEFEGLEVTPSLRPRS